MFQKYPVSSCFCRPCFDVALLPPAILADIFKNEMIGNPWPPAELLSDVVCVDRHFEEVLRGPQLSIFGRTLKEMI